MSVPVMSTVASWTVWQQYAKATLLQRQLTARNAELQYLAQHDMLLQSTILALMATRLRLEGFRTLDPATLRNAASAAAGATLLLDRVCADLGCPDSGR